MVNSFNNMDNIKLTDNGDRQPDTPIPDADDCQLQPKSPPAPAIMPSAAPPPPTQRGPRTKATLQERRRGGRRLVVDTLTNARTAQNLPMVVQTADTLSRLRKSGWDDLKTPTPLPSVPLPVDGSSDEDQDNEVWIRRAFAADAFHPAPEMMSTEYQSFPVMMELQCYSPAAGSPQPAPLFLIHPDAGFGVAYLGLPNLGRPVYGLSNTYLANGLAFKSIHCAAQIYLKHIRAVAREGPFLIGGWGCGGNIARECAAILSREWADHEEGEDEQVKEAKRPSRRVIVLMMDSYNDSWEPFKEALSADVLLPDMGSLQVSNATTVPATAARSPHGRMQRKVMGTRPCSPACSPSGLSFTDRCIVSNAALKAFATGTVSHLRDQYSLAASLTREEDPMPFAFRPAVLTGRDALKNPTAFRLDSFAHVFLLKAGRLGAFAHSLSFEEKSFLTRRFLSNVNGWATAELVPGLSASGPPEAGLRGNAVSVVTQVHTIPFTHSDLFSPAGYKMLSNPPQPAHTLRNPADRAAQGSDNWPTPEAIAHQKSLKNSPFILTSGQHDAIPDLLTPYDELPKEVPANPRLWHADDYRPGTEGAKTWIRHWTAEEVEQIERAATLWRASGRPLVEIEQKTFPLPESLAKTLDELKWDLVDGKGFALFKGLPTERWGVELSAIAYLGVGSYLGNFVSQNAKGHVLGHVKDIGKDPTQIDKVRIYATSARQYFHTDSAGSLIGLLCLHKSLEGGESDIVSSQAVWNEIQRTRPDLAKVLSENIWYFDRKGETSKGQREFVQRSIFRQVKGTDATRLSANYDVYYIRSLTRHVEAGLIPPVSALQWEAVEYLEATAQRLALHMVLDVGDMQFVSDCHVLHARTAYKDYPAPHPRRHLLRLWLSIPESEGGWKSPYPDSDHPRRGGIQVNDQPPTCPLEAE
ncbi:hypothetical protein OC835_000465 [Tilletia horrida]|nr:hypothetical protein OC835_000465 [Tilletia horrida]